MKLEAENKWQVWWFRVETFSVRLSGHDITYTERWVGKRASKVNENFEMKRASIVEIETKFVY